MRESIGFHFVFKAALRHAFSACVYCMRLRFQRNFVGWLKPNFENITACSKHTLKTGVATQLYRFHVMCVAEIFSTVIPRCLKPYLQSAISKTSQKQYDEVEKICDFFFLVFVTF
jgi:hypothetical protein